jgi:heme/copper-type cytochrome/quinol oxidase subunit 3
MSRSSLSETGFFGVLILAFLFYNVQPASRPEPKDWTCFKTGIFSLCLFASSFTIWRSERRSTAAATAA